MMSLTSRAHLLWAAFGISGAILLHLAQSEPKGPTNVDLFRETKVEQPLAGLTRNCQTMLDLQTAAYNGTLSLDKARDGGLGNNPPQEHRELSLKLSRNQSDIVIEITRTIGLLTADGAAVAFTEVLQGLREDMKRVQAHLEIGDVGITTQTIERRIIDTLQTMITALKRDFS
jgi:hypothetical protein